MRARARVPLDIVVFGLRTLRELPGTGRYASEVLRQTAVLVRGTTGLMIGLQLVLGGVLGIFANYLLRSIGGADYVGAVTSLGSGRGTVIVMFGYVFAAKVGCGLVAEIGSMRISDELDAFESVGLDPMRFVVATRLLAIWLYLPFIYCVAQAASELGAYLAVVHGVGEVSSGTFLAAHFGLRNPVDYINSFVEIFVIGTLIAVVAMYYGFRARGGPAEVGEATARSMVFNLVAVHFVYAMGTWLFYGSDPKLPFGG
jgi:phospholipid/cholesterol/gamma-HCH transport system permease protein